MRLRLLGSKCMLLNASAITIAIHTTIHHQQQLDPLQPMCAPFYFLDKFVLYTVILFPCVSSRPGRLDEGREEECNTTVSVLVWLLDIRAVWFWFCLFCFVLSVKGNETIRPLSCSRDICFYEFIKSHFFIRPPFPQVSTDRWNYFLPLSSLVASFFSIIQDD